MKNTIIILQNIIMALTVSFLIAGCSGDNGSNTSANGNGSIIAKLVWRDAKTTAKSVAMAPAGVTTVRFIITGSGMSPMQQDFSASAGTGTIGSVLAGGGRTFTAQGLDGFGIVIYQGSVGNITVQPGQTTDIGVITMLPLVPPAAPSGLTASAMASDQINLSWTDNATSEAGFKIERKTGAGGTYVQIGTTAADAIGYSDVGLSEATIYFYRIKANNDAGDSAYATETSASTFSPGPVDPPPAGLWQPAAGSTPSAGNYLYLNSNPGDYIGQGKTYTYTQADAIITVSATGGHLTVGIDGDQKWSGDFQAPSSQALLQTGYYHNLQRYPFHDTTRGGLNWDGEGRGSNTLTGWFVIDNVVYANGAITEIDLRFEQHSGGATPALRGQFHWKSNDTTTPPGPVNPPPAGLWQPTAGSTPVAGNYVYFISDSGDYIGQGLAYSYTPADAPITVSATGGYLSVSINGVKSWTGDFQTMNTINQLQPGYYAGLMRYPFHNPTKGGLDWSGDGRGCNTLTGWFAIDGVTYANGSLSAIDLRFEQHCEGALPALRGQIHWVQ